MKKKSTSSKSKVSDEATSGNLASVNAIASVNAVATRDANQQTHRPATKPPGYSTRTSSKTSKMQLRGGKQMPPKSKSFPSSPTCSGSDTAATSGETSDESNKNEVDVLKNMKGFLCKEVGALKKLLSKSEAASVNAIASVNAVATRDANQQTHRPATKRPGYSTRTRSKTSKMQLRGGKQMPPKSKSFPSSPTCSGSDTAATSGETSDKSNNNKVDVLKNMKGFLCKEVDGLKKLLSKSEADNYKLANENIALRLTADQEKTVEEDKIQVLTEQNKRQETLIDCFCKDIARLTADLREARSEAKRYKMKNKKLTNEMEQVINDGSIFINGLTQQLTATEEQLEKITNQYNDMKKSMQPSENTTGEATSQEKDDQKTRPQSTGESASSIPKSNAFGAKKNHSIESQTKADENINTYSCTIGHNDKPASRSPSNTRSQSPALSSGEPTCTKRGEAEIKKDDTFPGSDLLPDVPGIDTLSSNEAFRFKDGNIFTKKIFIKKQRPRQEEQSFPCKEIRIPAHHTGGKVKRASSSKLRQHASKSA